MTYFVGTNDLKEDEYEQKLAEIANGVQRSKSLDCEHIREVVASLEEGLYDKDESNGGKTESQHKVHKTPWGKVKGIIQTRKGSLKKKKSTCREESSVIGDSDEDSGTIPTPEITFSENASREFSSVSSSPTSKTFRDIDELQFKPDQMGGSINKRRLFAPLLTLTLPSTEELRAGMLNSLPTGPTKSPSPQTAQVTSPKDAFFFKDIDMQSALFDNQEVSPPSRLSKWSKVKNAFLTSTVPSSSNVHVSCSVPSSPSRVSSFIYDLEHEDLEGGDSGEETRNKSDDVFIEDSQADIQKTYRQLQMKLSAEFSKKLNEWEQLKSGVTQNYPITAGRTVANIDELSGGKGSRGKEHWETKSCSQIAQMSQGQVSREAAALQQLGEDNLSAEFKKKLEEWEKLKHLSSESPTSVSPGSRQLHFRKKIADWQRWMPGGSSKFEGSTHVSSSSSEHLHDDFSRRDYDPRLLEEHRLSSPKLGRKDLEMLSDKKKRFGRVRSSDSPTSMRNKWDEVRYGYVKTHFSGKNHHQGVKELAWLEKELSKIEREKQRLEKEKEKYEERLARLEKMKTAIGIDIKKKEVLVPTSTGLVRFQGISQKFTRKLYEWENARGIRPEASTFALLQPGYRPVLKRNGMNKEGDVTLPRSRSMGSVTDLSSADPTQPGMTHQPSSLSLNDMDDLSGSELPEDATLTDSGDEDMPEALIVEVEDVVEETASAMSSSPIAVAHTPVYRYANVPHEIASLSYRTYENVETFEDDDSPEKASYLLLERNIDLLGQLESEQGMCRQLEDEMENVNEQMSLVLKSKEEQTDSLERASRGIANQNEEDEEQIDRLKRSIKELERHQEILRQEGEHLQSDICNRNEQQAVIAQDLVGTVKRLQLINNDRNSQEPCSAKDFTTVQALSSQLLHMAEKLQTMMGEKLDETETATDEMTQLPFQLTKKIMELKQALNVCEGFSDMPSPSTITPDEVPSVTVKFLRKRKSDTTQPVISEENSRSTPETPVIVTLPRPNFEDHEVADDETEQYKTEGRASPSGKNVKMGSSPKKKLVRTKSFKRKSSQSKENYDSAGTNPVESSRSCEEIGNAPRSKFEGSGTRLKRERRVVKSRREMDLSKLCRDDETDKTSVSSGWSKRNAVTSSTADDNNNNDMTPFMSHFDTLVLDDCCVDQETSPSVVASVFVPTKRKIFSPLVQDRNGKTESVISYEIQDPPQETLQASDESSEEVREAEATVEDETSEKHSSRSDCVIPPCWILRETKSQPPSPAFHRRKLSFDKPSDSRESKPKKYDFSQSRISERSNLELEKFPESELERREDQASGRAKPDIGFPPMSPIFVRREIKNSKEAAPSIRMMIAKYNQKVNESGVKPDTKSGTVSPGWRSPIAERRVLTQAEGYQEGIGRFNRGETYRDNPFGMKKSASAGLIEFKVQETRDLNAGFARENSDDSEKDSPNSQCVLKSFSEGTMRQTYSFSGETESETLSKEPLVSKDACQWSEEDSHVPAIKLTLSHSKTVGTMPSYSTPRSHELHRSTSRAMKLQRAKEEFLSRNATGESRAPSECGTSSNTPSLSISSECDLAREDSQSLISNARRRDIASRQSYGSESSYGDDSSLATLGDDQKSLGIDRSVLIKSASAGMLTSDLDESDPCRKDSGATAKPSKFGFSSIASKFRKVKMRRHKEPDLSHLDTVSALCRQSLAVSVQPPVQSSNSKSCPSSPVLQRPEKTDSNSSGPSSWIPIPGKRKSKSRIF